MPADTNSAASTTSVPGSDNNSVSGGSAANAQPSNAQTNASRSQGSGYSAQAADIAGTDERPGADGGRGAPRHDSTDDDLSAEDLRALVKSLRAEAAAGRKAKQELDARQRAEEDAKLSEMERLQKQLADAQRERELLAQQTQERVIRTEARVAARELGLNPDKAHKLIDYAAIEFNDDGDPTNISELLVRALEELGLAPANASANAASSGPSAPNAAHPNAAIAAAQPGRFAPPPPVPATGATNPPRQGGLAAANGVFGPNERPRLSDRRLWSGPRRG